MIEIDKIDKLKLTGIEPITEEQYNKFIKIIQKGLEFFKNIPANEIIRVISHLDADGISSAAIIVNALNNENKEYNLTIYSQITEDLCQKIAEEEYTYYIITDLGSGQLSAINKFMKNKKILILDHHIPQCESENNITHINPHLAEIDGSIMISGSGVVFLFSCLLNKKNYDFGHIAIIGAVGDVQENSGFKGLNNLILNIAMEHKKIQVKNELNLFGKQTRPLYKLLEYSSNLEIPGITGSQNASVNFLNQLKIKQTDENDKLRTYCDLTEQEKKILTEHIIIKRINSGLMDQSKVLSKTYELINEENGTFKDAKEFSSILNACGRMDQAKTGVYACLNDSLYKKEAHQIQKDYKIEIVHGMNWIEKELKQKNNSIIETDKYMIINAQNNIMYTIIGTIGSIMTMSNKYPENYYLLSLAHNNFEKTIKVSLRVVGNNEDIDLHKIINNIIEKLGDGESGGHQHAAGAVIPLHKEEEFLMIAKKEFDEL
jgi:single-stranded-DNA-specific exonuclease